VAIVESLVRGIDKVNDVIGKAVSFLIVPMIGVMVLEVVLRYFFNAPTIWALESAQLLFGFMFMLGAGYTLKEDGHIRVEIAYMYTSRRAQAAMKIFALTFMFFFCGTVLYYGSIKAYDAITITERHFSVWSPYIFPSISCIPIAALLMISQGFSILYKEIKNMRESD
jgi:TRAP-type mannitol/chloroaromatic compound transport system permease small subunit